MTAGRPRKKIDWEIVDKMLEAHCTGSEIAATIGVNEKTFYRVFTRDRGKNLTTYAQEFHKKGNTNLRMAQVSNALNGNTTMQIWLGKNWLDQKDAPKPKEKFDGSLSKLLNFIQNVKNPEEFKKISKEKEDVEEANEIT
jgi:hypothetical protein